MTKTSRCRHRLKMLYHHGLLDRDEQPTRLNDGRKPLLYFLDRLAIPVLADELQVYQEDIDWKPRDNKVKWVFLDHLLATNDFRIAVEIAAKQNGCALHQWIDEKMLKNQEMKDFVEVPFSRSRTMRVTIVPDGYFYLTDGQYDYHHLLEVDRGTETVGSSKYGRRDYARKIRGYIAYYTSGKYQKRYGAKSMRVLTVTTGCKRLENLKAITEELGGREQFWFTTIDQVTFQSVLTNPIWSVAGFEGNYRFFDQEFS